MSKKKCRIFLKLQIVSDEIRFIMHVVDIYLTTRCKNHPRNKFCSRNYGRNNKMDLNTI